MLLAVTASTKCVSSIEWEKEAIKVLDAVWKESLVPPLSNEVELFVQSASLGIHILNSVFQNIFVWLRDVSNQEITQNDKQEEDEWNPCYPDYNNHDWRICFVFICIRTCGVVVHTVPEIVGRVHNLAYGVDEDVSTIHPDVVFLSHFPIFPCKWFSRGFTIKVNAYRLDDARAAAYHEDEEHEELIYLLNRPRHELNHLAEGVVHCHEVRDLY